MRISNMTRTTCHIAMYRVPKSENLKNFGH
jgi:hypothetical protein